VQSVVDGDRFGFPQARSDPGTNFRECPENEGVKKSLATTYSAEFNRRSRKKMQTVSEIRLGRGQARLTDTGHTDRHDGQIKPVEIEN
jgi:hypothetical protein